MKHELLFRTIVVGLLIGTSSSACSLGSLEYSCSESGGKATYALLVEIEALASTTKAFVTACDSGDPSYVHFTSVSQSELADELTREKGCTEADVAAVEKGYGRAYDCQFQSGRTALWVEIDPGDGSNTAHLTDAP